MPLSELNGSIVPIYVDKCRPAESRTWIVVLLCNKSTFQGHVPYVMNNPGYLFPPLRVFLSTWRSLRCEASAFTYLQVSWPLTSCCYGLQCICSLTGLFRQAPNTHRSYLLPLTDGKGTDRLMIDQYNYPFLSPIAFYGRLHMHRRPRRVSSYRIIPSHVTI